MAKPAMQLAGGWGHTQTLSVLSDPGQLLDAFLHTPHVGMAICDRQLRFLAVNHALAGMNGVPAAAHIGKTMREILGSAAGKVEAAFRRVFSTGESLLNFELSAELPTRSEPGHWLESYFPIKNSAGKVTQVGAIVVEVTKERKLEQSLQSLRRKLLQTRHEEQRRLARELHDSINQYHAALKMNLRRLGRSEQKPAERDSLLAESLTLVEQCLSETRVISHLLHPPSLGKSGFATVARWYVREFEQRSGIRVELKFPARMKSLPRAVEQVMFRVLQEALTNVHRHAEAANVRIELQRRPQQLVLIVHDGGRGIARQTLRRIQQADGGGVGVAGMRERVRDLGGVFEIESSRRGTLVRAAVPLQERAG